MENSTSFFEQFMQFIIQYNIIGVALGLIIATKVGDLVKSLVEDVITPGVLSPVFNKLGINKLEDLSWKGILWGKALARLIDFIIILFIIYIIIKNFGISTK